MNDKLTIKRDGVVVEKAETLVVEVVAPGTRPAALYSVEAVMYSQMAILMKKKDEPDGLSNMEWKRLNDIIKMFKGISEIELTSIKASVLEGLTDKEIIDLVDEAKRTLLENK